MCGVRPRFSWMTSTRAAAASRPSPATPDQLTVRPGEADLLAAGRPTRARRRLGCRRRARPTWSSPAMVAGGAVDLGAAAVRVGAAAVVVAGLASSSSPHAASSAAAAAPVTPIRPSRRNASRRLRKPSSQSRATSSSDVVLQRHRRTLWHRRRLPSARWSCGSGARCGRTGRGTATRCRSGRPRTSSSRPTPRGATRSRATRRSTALPSATTVASWAEQAPDGFRFLFKLPRTITHERRLRNADAEVQAVPRAARPARTPGRADRRSSCRRRSGRRTSARWRRSCAASRRSAPRRTASRSRSATRRSSTARSPARRWPASSPMSAREWIVLDSTTLFAAPPTSDAERETWARKPRLPVHREAVSDRPVVRFIGRDDPAATVAGWQPWIPVVADVAARGPHADGLRAHARQRRRRPARPAVPRPGAGGRARAGAAAGPGAADRACSRRCSDVSPSARRASPARRRRRRRGRPPRRSL